ncbi:MAG: hemolysin family protein [Acidimicrobiia bacterium]
MTWFAAIGAVLVFAVNATIRAAGASMVRTPRADALHDAGDGDHRAQTIADLLEDRPRLQPALGMINAGLLVLVAIAATWLAARSFTGWSLAAALLALAFVLVFAGDLLPRTLGRRRPRALAYRFAWLLRPVVALGDAAADLVSDLDVPEEDPQEEDQADSEERELISQVLDFTDTIVREVMVPRPDMVTVPGNASTDVALDVVLASGKSRIPVVGEHTDDILGVLYARDLLQLMDDEAAPRPSSSLMHPAYFVPETKRVPELLREMQTKQVHLAVVVDEFGGTAGVVSIEDLLEELVGEIADEYDQEEPMVTRLDAGGYVIDARLGVDELADLLGIEVPGEDWDTVGGLVLGLAGRVPRQGESFPLSGFTFTAQRIQGRRVAQVRVVPQ